MERMENPFENLHPKIYYRHKIAEPKREIIDNKKEIKMDLKSSPLLSVNLKRDRSAKHSNLFDGCSAEKATRREQQHDNSVKRLLNNKTYLRDRDTVANLNRRNSYMSEDSYNGEKLALPSIILPASAAKDNRQLTTGFVASSKSNKVLFPSIKEVPSFIPPLQAEEKRAGKRWRKRIRVIQNERISEEGADESWLNTYAAYPAISPARESIVSPIIQRQSSNFSRMIPEVFNSRNLVTSQAQSPWTYRHSDHTKGRDYMIVKAKIHRSSSFL